MPATISMLRLIAEFDAFASPGKAQERGPGEGAARGHVPLVHGEYGGLAGTARFPLCGVLHPQPGHQALRSYAILQIGGIMSAQDIKEVVKEKYGQAALRAAAGGSSCCGSAPSSEGCCDPITSSLYDGSQTGQVQIGRAHV